MAGPVAPLGGHANQSPAATAANPRRADHRKNGSYSVDRSSFRSSPLAVSMTEASESVPEHQQSRNQRPNGHHKSVSSYAFAPSLPSPAMTENDSHDPSHASAAPDPWDHTQPASKSRPTAPANMRRTSFSLETGKWPLPIEVLSAVLIPLPLILSAFVLAKPSPSSSLDTTKLSPEQRTQSRLSPRIDTRQRPYLSFAGVCSLTAASLVLISFWGEISNAKSHKRAQKATRRTPNALLSKASLQRICLKILAIGLPFFAASKIGGVKVAVVLLAAFAGGLAPGSSSKSSKSRESGPLHIVKANKWTFLVLTTQILLDLMGPSSQELPLQLISGYLSLALSTLVIPPPFANREGLLATGFGDTKSVTGSFRREFRNDSDASGTSRDMQGQSPMIATPQDTDNTIAAGVLATLVSFIVFMSAPRDYKLTPVLLFGGSIVSVSSAISLLMVRARLLSSHRTLNLALGSCLCLVLQQLIDFDSLTNFGFQLLLAGALCISVFLDTPRIRPSSLKLEHRHTRSLSLSGQPHSRISGYLIQASEGIPFLHSILVEKDSRRILYFMCLNLSFMAVQTFYALVTGSLGLLSDSIHMLFDCLALLVGLCAAVMSKWPPSLRFPYGFGKVDTLAGFANGVFLMLISIEIIYEAFERFFEGVKMQRLGELLTVSFLGLLVNLVGMMAFGHAHAHGHGHNDHHGHAHHASHDHHHDHSDTLHSHSHSHSHSHNHAHSHSHSHSHSHDHSPAYLPTPHPEPSPFLTPANGQPPSPLREAHSHSDHEHESCQHHDHGHGHSSHGSHDHHHVPAQSHGHHHHDHGGENMHGIFLHVLADTMGSVAVVCSTILIHYTGWYAWDAIASLIIAVLIFISAIPLVHASASRLLLAVPASTEFDVREALGDVGGLRGVATVTAPRFWVSEGHDARVQGVVHVVAGKSSDLEDVGIRARRCLKSRGMDVLVQVEREGEGRCWCGGVKPA